MKKTDSITENKDFRRLYYRGRSLNSPFLVLYWQVDRPSRPRERLGERNALGITVSAKVGKAVVRNRVRRWIKEAYRMFEPNLIGGVRIVIVAKKAASEKEGADFWKIKKALGGCLKKAGLFAE